MTNQCPLCGKRVSDWQMACGKTVVIADQVCHKACVLDRDVTIKSVEDQIRKSA